MSDQTIRLRHARILEEMANGGGTIAIEPEDMDALTAGAAALRSHSDGEWSIVDGIARITVPLPDELIAALRQVEPEKEHDDHARSDHPSPIAPLPNAAETETGSDGPSVATPRQACEEILKLSAGWDADGCIGPTPPLSWETVARLSIDFARYAVRSA